MFRIFALWLLVISQFSFGLPESEVYPKIVEMFEEGRTCEGTTEDFWTLKSLRTPPGQLPASYNDKDSYKLRYSRFGCSIGKNGSIVISPGRGEASIDYYETALDLTKAPYFYGPIYVIDHRGQGFSPRLLPNKSKGHVGQFMDYIYDLKAVVEAIEMELKDMGRTNQPLFYTSNSMGGAIGIGYFQLVQERNPFAAASIHGAQIIVNYLSFLKPLETYEQHGFKKALKDWALRSGIVLFGKNQGVALNGISQVRCGGGGCENFSAPDTFGDYKKGTRKFVPDTEKIMTHSESRYNLATYFRDQVNWGDVVGEHYGPEENWEGIYIGGSTNQWNRETSYFNLHMVGPSEIQKMTHIPMQIIMGERDLRGYREYGLVKRAQRWWKGEKLVDMYHHIKFCDDMNNLGGRCNYVELEGGFHELFKESDQWRKATLDQMHAYFCQQSGVCQ